MTLLQWNCAESPSQRTLGICHTAPKSPSNATIRVIFDRSVQSCRPVHVCFVPMPLVAVARQSNGAADRGARPIREAAFASLKAPPRPVPAPVDPADGSEEWEASARG